MGVTRCGAAAGFVVCAAATAASAQRVERNAPPPLFPRVAQALQRSHQAAPVPAGLEIEVLDPNVDPRGNPAVVLRPAPPVPIPGAEGRTLVDIPPTALVHRYYYTGDRNFQAQLLPGGPCIVVASHPRTGERMYVPLSLPPGAPRVFYTDKAIEYDYGTQAVTIDFCCLFHDKPKVTYRQGVSLAQKVQNVAVGARDATRRLIGRTALPEAVDKTAAGAKNVVVTTVDRANDLAEFVSGPPRAILRATPLPSLVTSSAEDRAAKERDTLTRRATESNATARDAFLRTVR